MDHDHGGDLVPAGRIKADEFSIVLAWERMNPGTSADLVTTALYLELFGGYRV